MRMPSRLTGKALDHISRMHMTPVENNPETNNISSGDLEISDVSYAPPMDEGNESTIIATRTEILSGPLPHPQLLKEYDNIIKDGAERIMVMAEKQQASRIEGERETREANKHIANEQLKIQKRGQIIAAMVICLIMGLVVLFTFTGHEVVAYVLLGIGLASIISAFTGAEIKKRSNKQ